MSMRYVLSGILLITSICSTLPVEGADQTPEPSQKGGELFSSTQSDEQTGADASTPQVRREGTRPGIAKDELQACLAAIPAGSSAGQRMLAEQRCHDEQEARSSSHAAPNF